MNSNVHTSHHTHLYSLPPSLKRKTLGGASLATLIISTIGLTSATSVAQENNSATTQDTDVFTIEEVVVTARRRSESLRDVPGTVTALTRETIRSAGIQRAEDFISLTPGVSIVDAAEVGDTQVNIRGINGARDAENSFAFILDGILYTNPAAFNREYTNLSQIEIFKGPQGAIYGRSAAAGAILVTTDRPDGDTSGTIRGSYGNNNSYSVVGAFDGALSETIFFRLGGDYKKTDGFFRNSFQNDSAIVDAYEAYNINGRLVYDNSDNFSLDIKARYGDVDASAISFNATFHLPNFAAAAGAPLANEDVNDHDFFFNPNIVSDNDQKALELSAKFDYDMGWATLTGWALYSDIENDLIADGTSAAFGFFNSDPACQQSALDLANNSSFSLPDPQIAGTTPVGIIFTPDFSGSFYGPYTPTTCDGIQEQLRDQKDVSLELRLASPDDQDLRWMAGLYFLDIDRQVGVSLNRDSGARPIRGLLQTSGPNKTQALAFDDFSSQVFAVFGQVEYDITDTVELSFAARYDREEREVSSLVPTDVTSDFIDLNFDGLFNDPLNPGLSSLINPNGIIPDQERTFEEFQPKLSLTWDATPDLTLFANWGVGFKAGGFNNSGSAATVNIFINNFINGVVQPFADQLADSLPVITDDYDKETSSAFEVGFKSSLFDGRLKLEGAGYYTEVDDMQFFEFFVGSFGLLRVVSNIDEVEIYGFELGATGYVNEYLTLFAGFNLTESEIKRNSSRPDTVGNQSPYTPDYTLNLGAQVQFPVEDDIEFFTRADFTAVGETWFHTQQEGQNSTIFQPLFAMSIFGPDSGGLGIADFSNARRDGYQTLDMRLGLRHETWAVTVFARNLTNEKYLEEVISAPEFGGSFNHPAARRSYGVELNYDF